MKKFYILTIFILCSGCASQAIDKNAVAHQLPSPVQIVETSSLEEISKLKPQIHPPIKLAVTQQIRNGYYENWSPEEVKEIESWATSLKEAGFISELVIIPQSMTAKCNRDSANDCVFINSRKAAAMLHSDAVLVMNTAWHINTYANPLSILNLTIIGMWIVPAHSIEVYRIYEGALIDTNNGYVYGIARGEGSAKQTKALMYSESNQVDSEASCSALKTLGTKINDQALKAMKHQ